MAVHWGLIVRSKLIPPRLHPRILRRPRLIRRLLEALHARLTVVQGGAGYGKSTALAMLAEEGIPLIWYHLDAEDTDPMTLVIHLLYSFRTAFPQLSEVSLALLEDWERNRGPRFAMAIDALLSELVEQITSPILLVFDDVHILNQARETWNILDRVVTHAPPDLHIALSTRYPVKFLQMANWQVRGEILQIGERELAFTPGETMALFRDQYGFPITDREVMMLTERTEGWPIALQMVWQILRSEREMTIARALERLVSPTEGLFVYLAQEVLERQPPEIRQFLLTTAVLQELTPATCDCLREASNSAAILHSLVERGLFVVDLGNGYMRYHHLFREFLTRQVSPEETRRLHLRAAACFRQREEWEKAIPHLLAVQAWEDVAHAICHVGRRMVQVGRLETLADWIRPLPPNVLDAHPLLMIFLGDIARLSSRFNEALNWYRQAEERFRRQGDVQGIGQALRGQARVYLDTVNPAQAEGLLQEALRLSDGIDDRESQARLLELMAENRLNLGHPEEAEKLLAQARQLRQEGPTETELSVRVLLRTGRLDEARRLLEERVEEEQREPVRRPRAHRETLLLLSLILSLQGEGDGAYRRAVEGTERGRALRSPFIVAVGYMRQGHAWLLRKGSDAIEEACRCYQEAIRLGDQLAVPRLKVEAFWGLCRARGFRGEIAAAREAAEQGIEIAQRAGDEWISALIRVSMGAGYALAGAYDEATEWLDRAWTAFGECNDTFGQAVTRMWQCLVWWNKEDEVRLERGMRDLLQLIHKGGYEFLFERRTLLGPPDPRCLVPLLLFARDTGCEPAMAEGLLARLGLTGVEIHPGYQLRVQTLGSFRLWRGDHEVGANEWQREKARQLLLLLITHRDRLLERDMIIEALWPEVDPESGGRDFKVTLNTLCRVLEPYRSPRSPSAYILRDGTRYGLRPGADIWLDAAAFEKAVREGDMLFHRNPDAALDRYREALRLYQGDYLEEYPYEEWCSEERERLLTLFLRTADRLASELAAQERWEETVEVCQTILERDPCWEQAYRLMMIAYTQMGNRAQALRVYQRCVERLWSELEVKPSAETVRLYESIRASKTTHIDSLFPH